MEVKLRPLCKPVIVLTGAISDTDLVTVHKAAQHLVLGVRNKEEVLARLQAGVEEQDTELEYVVA